MSYRKIWEKYAILREGKRLDVYLDSLGKPTVGIGHLVMPEDGLEVGDRITEAQCAEFFRRDSETAILAAKAQAKESGNTTDEWIAALISVNFQLGTSWTRKFKNTWAQIVAGEYDKAIENLQRSLWYRQTPARVNDFIFAIKGLKKKAELAQERPLAKTRTIQGAGVASAGVGVSIAAETLSEVSGQLEPLAGYADTIKIIFLVVALAGIALTVWARIDDRKRGYR